MLLSQHGITGVEGVVTEPSPCTQQTSGHEHARLLHSKSYSGAGAGTSVRIGGGGDRDKFAQKTGNACLVAQQHDPDSC